MKLVPTLTVLALSAACGATRHTAPPAARAETPLARELTVGIVAVDGVSATELAAPADVFQLTTKHAHPAMKVFTVGPSREPIVTSAGVRVAPDWSFSNAPPIDVLVVPGGGRGKVGSFRDLVLVEFVATRGKDARFVLGLGEGVFVLAKAGLLDGHACTASPSDVKRLHEEFPKLRVREDAHFVYDGSTITSVGGAGAYEVLLHVVELVSGEPAARGIAADLGIERAVKRVDARRSQ